MDSISDFVESPVALVVVPVAVVGSMVTYDALKTRARRVRRVRELWREEIARERESKALRRRGLAVA